MSSIVEVLPSPPIKLDYSLTGVNATLAVEKGLAEADWYQCPVPRETMRKLLERRDGPAIRDTILWFALIFGTGYATYALWGTWWAILPYAIYSAIYASSSDSRWHETGHGTAFKTDWMNNALYEIASFMLMREATLWRWSHNRHHSDTIIVGRDREIAVPRPPDWKDLLKRFFNIGTYEMYFKQIVLHSLGRMSAEEKTYIPETEFHQSLSLKRASMCFSTLCVIALAIYERSILPLMFVGIAGFLRRLAGASLLSHSARRTCGKRPRSPPELQNGVYEPDQPLSLLEHGLPRGASYVPAGALSRSAASYMKL